MSKACLKRTFVAAINVLYKYAQEIIKLIQAHDILIETKFERSQDKLNRKDSNEAYQ